MNTSTPVNFETYYFHELLDNIRKGGEKEYDEESREYLEKLLTFLEAEEDAQTSIEKLAKAQSTSDLAIFFYDILEQLHTATPDESMEKVDGRVDDFLEIFQVFLMNEEWKESIEKEIYSQIGDGASASAQTTEDDVSELSLTEYCQQLISDKISKTAAKMPVDEQKNFVSFAEELLQNPELANQIELSVDHPNATKFSQLTYAISQFHSDENLAENMPQFEDNLAKWVTSLKKMLIDNADEIQQIFQPTSKDTVIEQEETAESFSEDMEQPFEALFDEAEQELEETEETASESADELEELVKSVSDFDSRAVASEVNTEEEKERRQLLRDYVINEIRSYTDEMLELTEHLESAPGNAEHSAKLKESLKGLKDLGQIHGYPAVEQAAENLLVIFNQLHQQGRPFIQANRPVLESLFDQLPLYVDAAIAEDDAEQKSIIAATVEELRSNLLDVEPVSTVVSAETLEGAFQDVVMRYARKIHAYLASPDAEEAQTLSNIFDNLQYWNDLLMPKGANKTIELVQTLLEKEHLENLGEADRQLVSDFVKSWETAYVNLSDKMWNDYAGQLSALLAPPTGEIGILEAREAFEAVTLQQLAHLQLALEDLDHLPQFLETSFPQFLTTLAENCTLIEHSSLNELAVEIQSQLASVNVDEVADAKAVSASLHQFLDHLKPVISETAYIENDESILDEFQNIFMAEAEKTAVFDGEEHMETADELLEFIDEQEVSDVEEAAESDDMSEEDIFEMFKTEAYSYISQMQTQLDALETNTDDSDGWRQFGVIAHTLRGSAKMIGREDIVELADPIDSTVDLMENGIVSADLKLVNIFRNIVNAINERVNGKEIDQEAVLSDLDNYLTPAAGISEETQMENAPDVEYIYLSEQDPELLNIFQNEVASNFDVVEKNLTNLEKFTYDKEAVQQVERAVHEIRAAAKMLGISEIASIADKLETIFEKMAQGQIEDYKITIPVTRRAMYIVRQLTDNYKVRKDMYDSALANLEALETGNAPVLPMEFESAETVTPDQAEAGFFEEPSDEPALFTYEESDTTTTVPEPETAEEDLREVTEQVLSLYLQEAREQIDDINYLLLKLEKDPGNQELQHHLMRCMHTLKGSSGMVYANHVESLAHRSEDILEKNIQDEQKLAPELFDLLFEVMDEIKYIIDSLETTSKEKVKKHEELFLRLDNYFRSLVATESVEPVADEDEEIEEEPEEAFEAPVQEAALEESDDAVTLVEETMPEAPKRDTYLRLKIDKMNHMLNLAAESVISNNQFKNQLDGLKGFIPMLNSNLKLFRETEDYLDNIVRENHDIQENMEIGQDPAALSPETLRKQFDSMQRVLKNLRILQDEMTSITHILKDNTKTYDENLQKLGKLGNELLDEIMQARLVPINMLFQRFHRPIRDLARQLKKQIRLNLKGEETELDRALVDELYEPLLHLIRNAIDHGLETADERLATGKNPEGLLQIVATRDRNQVIIEVKDDGHGIDVNEVKQAAIDKDLLTEEDAEQLSEQEIFDFLFYPGFSTAKDTTLVSGRGVGLDAVKAQIEKAKGDIRLYTEPGKGTTFSIRVPISLSVIQSMLVDVNGHVYSIPLMQVEETLNISGQDLLQEDERHYIRYRERKIPVMQLSKLLKMQDQPETNISASSNYPVIMVQDEGNRVALLVDKIIRREEILIKSLGPGLRRLKYISGGSIMAEGQVVLVLDIPQIIQDILKGAGVGQKNAADQQPETARAPKTGEKRPYNRHKTIEGRKPVALIVDDSLSIRKYLSSLLIQKGYVTDTARNGYEALELLNKQAFDIMVTDLEMPKLSGYELIETIRYDQRFNHFPIIVLTGRAGDNFRQITQELGADGYVIKPFKDRELFEQLDKFIEYKS